MEARQDAAHHMEQLALEAVQSVATAEAAPLWLAAYEKAAALGGHCRRLNKALVQQLTLLPTSPLRVSLIAAILSRQLCTLILLLFISWLWHLFGLWAIFEQEHAVTAACLSHSYSEDALFTCTYFAHLRSHALLLARDADAAFAKSCIASHECVGSLRVHAQLGSYSSARPGLMQMPVRLRWLCNLTAWCVFVLLHFIHPCSRCLLVSKTLEREERSG